MVLAGKEGPNGQLTVRAQGRGFQISPFFCPAYPPFLALLFPSLGVLCSSLTKEVVLFGRSLSTTPAGANHTPSAFDFLCHLGHVTCPFRGEDLHLSLKRLHALHGWACELCWAENSLQAYLGDSGGEQGEAEPHGARHPSLTQLAKIRAMLLLFCFVYWSSTLDQFGGEICI